MERKMANNFLCLVILSGLFGTRSEFTESDVMNGTFTNSSSLESQDEVSSILPLETVSNTSIDAVAEYSEADGIHFQKQEVNSESDINFDETNKSGSNTDTDFSGNEPLLANPSDEVNQMTINMETINGSALQSNTQTIPNLINDVDEISDNKNKTRSTNKYSIKQEGMKLQKAAPKENHAKSYRVLNYSNGILLLIIGCLYLFSVV
ncbi:uncharacterized protein LOC123305915 [Chrysoperla carnea]|uniref:uncharacterized protein LOC123305915 n=1 Tax=Chrysoperla carnea TaxID=189513 RepID=UPI001D07D484|nr:uncharacterized protein LOC123305915 [Chrysoperla carnea]